MPRKYRSPRTRKRRKGMWTRDHVYQLESGYEWMGTAFTGQVNGVLRPDGPGWYEACAAWQFLAPQILADWIQRTPVLTGHRGGAGTRPWAFWHIDKREPLRRIDGGLHPHKNPARIAYLAEMAAKYPHMLERGTGLYYGRPSAYIVPDDFEAVYESEAEYLDRLQLWLPGEIELGIPLLAAEIAKAKREFADPLKKPSPRDLDLLRRAEAMYQRLTKQAESA
jgi:hypothetical protein